jgi:hypothetical protein
MPQQTKSSSTRRSSASRSRGGNSGSARASSRATSSRSNASRSRAKGRASSSRSSGSRSSAQRSSSSDSKRAGVGPLASATDAARSGVKNAGSAVGEVAQKAKVPALAAGAGIVGLAGGVALAGRSARKRVLGVPLPTKSGTQAVSKNLADASKNVGSFGEGRGSLAAEVRKVREGVGNGAEKRRSPIEVVLQGLTRRR